MTILVQRKCWAFITIFTITASCLTSLTVAAPPDLQAAGQFLKDMYNGELQMCAEAPIAAPDVYWLLNDNLEVSTAMRNISGGRAYRMLQALHSYGIMTNDVVEAFHGQGIPWPPLGSSLVVLDDQSPDYIVKMEYHDQAVMNSWMNYGDLVAMRAISLHNEGDDTSADALLDSLFAMWDGIGINDTVRQNHPDGYYASYKLGLLLLASDVVGKTVPFRAAVEDRLGLQQREDGGIVTDYLPDGTPIGDANVETTTHVILGVRGEGLGEANLINNGAMEMEALPHSPGAPLDWYHSGTGWAWSTAESRSGSYSILLDDQSATESYDWRSQAFSVTEGEKLRATFFHKQTVNAGSLGVFLRFWQDENATVFISQASVDITSSNAAFEPAFLFDVLVPPGAAYADVAFISNADTVGSFYFDDVFVGVLPDSFIPDEFTINDFNRIPNSDVEAEGDPGYPLAWYHSSANVAWDDSHYISPTHSLKIDDMDYFGTGDWRSQEFAVTEGENLTLGYYADFLGIVGNFGTFIRYFDAAGTWLGQDVDLIDGSNPFGPAMQYRELKTTVPAGAVKADVFIFTNDPFNFGEAYYDNIQVNDNLVSNGRIELGVGDDPNDWFHGAMAGRSQPVDVPSAYYALQVEDTDTNGSADWRCKPFAVAGYGRLSFAFQSKRTGLTGDAVALLRFFTEVDGSGNNPEGWISQETIMLAGDTEGFEISALVADVPEDAQYADVVLGTLNDQAITGILEFDDVIVSPTVNAPPSGPCGEADLDEDGDADVDDFLFLVNCLLGPGAGYPIEGDDGLLRNNLLSNPDVETESDGNPFEWYYGTMASWVTDAYVSETHSLHIDDNSTAAAGDWRSEIAAIPAGTTELIIQWNWLYQNIDGEFAVTIRFYENGAYVSETNFWSGQNSTVGWEKVRQTETVPAAANSFDILIRTISGAGIDGTGATGRVWIDDISVAPAGGDSDCERADFDADGDVDLRDAAYYDLIKLTCPE